MAQILNYTPPTGSTVREYYDTNDTTRKIGQTVPAKFIKSESRRKEYAELVQAQAYAGNYDTRLDFYILGVLHGIELAKEGQN